MKQKKFSHSFSVNKYGCPVSDCLNTGHIQIRIHKDDTGSQVSISGDRDGLLSLARKIVETAEAEAEGYHVHMDGVEIPHLKIRPQTTQLMIGKQEEDG